MHEEAQNALNAEEGQEAQRMPLNAEEEKVSQNALNSVKCRSTCIKENMMAHMKRDVYKRDVYKRD